MNPSSILIEYFYKIKDVTVAKENEKKEKKLYIATSKFSENEEKIIIKKNKDKFYLK